MDQAKSSLTYLYFYWQWETNKNGGVESSLGLCQRRKRSVVLIGETMCTSLIAKAATNTVAP
jgi:hypothetical protein